MEIKTDQPNVNILIPTRTTMTKKYKLLLLKSLYPPIIFKAIKQLSPKYLMLFETMVDLLDFFHWMLTRHQLPYQFWICLMFPQRRLILGVFFINSIFKGTDKYNGYCIYINCISLKTILEMRIMALPNLRTYHFWMDGQNIYEGNCSLLLCIKGFHTSFTFCDTVQKNLTEELCTAINDTIKLQ